MREWCSRFFSAALGCALCCASAAPAAAAPTLLEDRAIELEVRPRICTLAANEDHCETTVRAYWRSTRDESLCLVITGRPDVKRCWEDFSEGRYSVELVFSEDLIVELRDPELQRVLASDAISVIREALRLRRKRRQPWNVFY